ncbi:hypothetical protein JCM5353_006156 [Sporobolomyces roseus]
MSTSTSTVPPSRLGECVVCGKESSTRCGDCVQGGVKWMFFCSREHQKLIWPIHKRICGGRFKWPSLSPKEGQKMIASNTLPIGQFGKTNWLKQFATSRFEQAYLVRGSPVSIDKTFEVAVKALQKEEVYSRSNQEHLRYFRYMYYMVNVSRVLTTGDRAWKDLIEVMASDPFGFNAFHQARSLQFLEIYEETEWYSDFQHHMLIFIAVLASVREGLETADPIILNQHLDSLAHSMAQPLKIARDVIAKTHPKDADVIRKEYIPDMMKESSMTSIVFLF